jgi:hypothetical protein
MKKTRTSTLLIALFAMAVSMAATATVTLADPGGRAERFTRGTGRGGATVVSRSAGRGGAAYSRGYGGRGGYTTYAGPRHGGGHFSGNIWIGPGWGYWDPFFYPYYPYPYPAYRYYDAPTVVVPQEPQEYITQEPQKDEGETGYWYYCRKPEGYYPYVERCPSGWMKVVPNTTPPGQEEQDKEE